MKYTKENAPKGIKVDMEYGGDPIWVSDPEDLTNDLPYINGDLSDFPFPPILMHMLTCYQEAWETAYSCNFIPSNELSDEFENNPIAMQSINQSLNLLGKACEDMLENWLKENKWGSSLYRTPYFHS